MSRTAISLLLLLITCALGTDLSAQEPRSSTSDDGAVDVQEMKEEMLEMNERMYEIIIGIESVEDVQEADDEIGEIFEELAENIAEALEYPTGMATIEQAISHDSEIQEWDQKINAAMEELRTSHPDAAAEFDRVMQKHSMKIQEVMMEASLEAMEDPSTEDEVESEVENRDDSGDMNEMKEAMIEMSQEMHGIVTSIETVEDVQGADEEIGEVFDDLIENLREAMKGDPAALQQMGIQMENDPEMREWGEKMDAAMTTLKQDHPEAAAELEKVMQKHSRKLMALMSEVMRKMNPEDMEGMMEGSGETSDGSGMSTEKDMPAGVEPGE